MEDVGTFVRHCGWGEWATEMSRRAVIETVTPWDRSADR